MNESEKILRLLNQNWDYRHNNNSFASKFTRSYFGKGSDFIYISEMVDPDIGRYWKNFLNAMRIK